MLLLNQSNVPWWLVIRNGSPAFAIQAKDKAEAMQRAVRAFMYFEHSVEDDVLFQQVPEGDIPSGISRVTESYFNTLSSLNIPIDPETVE